MPSTIPHPSSPFQPSSRKWEKELERQILSILVKEVKKRGLTATLVHPAPQGRLHVSDNQLKSPAAFIEKILVESFAIIYLLKGKKKLGWITLSPGEGINIITDFSLGIEPILQSTHDFVERWRD